MPDSSLLQSRQALQRLHLAARTVFAPIAVACLIGFGWQSRALLKEMLMTAQVGYLLLAVLIWSSMSFIAPLLSTVIFRGRGIDLSYLDAARIHISNLPARYIPGGIWHTVGRIVDFRQAGIGKADLTAFVLLENALAAGLAFVIGGSLLAFYRGLQGWGLIAAISAAAGALLLVLLPALAKFHASRAAAVYQLRYYLSGVLIVAASWCVAAAAFVAFTQAFPGLSESTELLEIAATYLFSWAIGFVAVFAPQGVGVFEVVAADLLRGASSLTGIAALLAAFRLAILLSDAIVWLLGRALPGNVAQRE